MEKGELSKAHADLATLEKDYKVVRIETAEGEGEEEGMEWFKQPLWLLVICLLFMFKTDLTLLLLLPASYTSTFS